MRQLAVLAPLFVVVACGTAATIPGTDDDAGTSPTNDAGGSRDGAATPDSGDTPTKDAATTDAARDATSDATADATTPPTGRGQCFTDANCGAGKTCIATAPGGFCAGCAGSCSVGPADQCNFGTCNASCTNDVDCAAGLRCNSGGTCVLKSCAGVGTCGPWHACDGGFCRRISCNAGETCPSGTDCKTTSTGKLCVETFLTYP